MPTTRKKIIKTVYKDEDSDAEEIGDYSDSGSEAKISEEAESTENEDISSAEEFKDKPAAKTNKRYVKKRQFAKSFVNKITKQNMSLANDEETASAPLLSVKDLTDEDKLLPPVLNLSESDSSDNEEQTINKHEIPSTSALLQARDSDGEHEVVSEYQDVWSKNQPDNSGDIAKHTFEQLKQHNHEIEETKATLAKYAKSKKCKRESNVKDLLALGEEFTPSSSTDKCYWPQVANDNSESETEDWEEVKESKGISQQGIQLIVDFPDGAPRKSKQIDVEMMMRRKINRVKKEYQIYMHKVHVLCWLGHGNYVSRILNDQEILAAALSLVPSKNCYPGERVDIKYVEQITTWFKDKITLKQEKNEDKYKPKALPLKNILMMQMKSRVATTKKLMVFIFVSMIRALGLQCRVMFNFTVIPLKPPSSELCSLSTKPKTITEKDIKSEPSSSTSQQKATSAKSKLAKSSKKRNKSDVGQISQLDGNDDTRVKQKLTRKVAKSLKGLDNQCLNKNESTDVSPPKRAKRSATNSTKEDEKPVINVLHQKSGRRNAKKIDTEVNIAIPRGKVNNKKSKIESKTVESVDNKEITSDTSPLRTRQKRILSNRLVKSTKAKILNSNKSPTTLDGDNGNQETKLNVPKILVTKENEYHDTSSKYFTNKRNSDPKVSEQNNENIRVTRKRSRTACPVTSLDVVNKNCTAKQRTKSAPGVSIETSIYFKDDKLKKASNEKSQEAMKDSEITNKRRRTIGKDIINEDKFRVSHKDLVAKTNNKSKKTNNDVKSDLVRIIKSRVKEAKLETKSKIIKEKVNEVSDDSDYLPEEDDKGKRNSDSDGDFKPTKISPKPRPHKIDRRVLSPDKGPVKYKTDVWCEIYVEELEQWISVDVVKAQVHCCNEVYGRATHPVCYIVGWDNNNYLKDLTRRYVPHWNTVTRKLRAEQPWWDKAVQPWLGPKTARDREEDECLDKLLLDAPLPKSITEYKNHPLYALKRHLLKFEAIYPPDAATLGFVRGEAVYARDCVYVCRSRDIWLKEAKVVRLGEKPYKIVKARPKWDKLSNKVITDQLLEVFGPWQVQDYEPPTAENGVVPRNAYGNVELFKECMLPKGTVHIKLPGLNKVARKLNIDCASAVVGFDFNGGWSHPVYDGFVVCEEFQEIITDAWVKDQEEQERREQEKMDARIYGNWKRLIKGLLIRERLKVKYGFEEPSTSQDSKKKSKTPRLLVKKKN